MATDPKIKSETANDKVVPLDRSAARASISDEFFALSKAPAYTPVARVKAGADGRNSVLPGTPYEKADDPVLGHEPIDARRYTSAEFMRLEWERMWTKVWLVAGRLLDVPEPGDYLVTEIGRESIIVVRQVDGGVRAFYNVCQHRGNRLRPCGRGSSGASRSFKCMYHHWEYNLDGSFRRIPDVDTFPQGAPQYALSEVKCETWGSFIWFNLNPEAESLAEFLGPIPQHLDPYHFERMVQTRDITVEWDCNWKASVDAFNESYHVQGIHPQLLWYLHDLDIQIDCYERHSRYLIPFGALSPRVRKPQSIPEPIKSIMKGAGIDPADYDEPIANIRRDVQIHKRVNGPGQGKDYSELNDDQLTDDYHYTIFPNLSLNLHADDFWVFRQRPHATDPNRMYYDIWTYELVPQGQAWPRRAKHESWKHGDKSIGLVLDQDAANLPGVQAGMHSRGFRGLWLGRQELRIRHFHEVIDAYLFPPGSDRDSWR
jgi:phenylpropionate dioxygenase-like ring-hydroxylating dioxygenase large terminal subunit